jgi:transposase-like protein
MNIAKQVKELRAWLLELDPTGKWEARVTLGGLPTAIMPAQWHFEEAGAREDFELTRRLTAEFDEIHSPTGRAPACPYCASMRTYEQNRLPSHLFPTFRCSACRKVFNRRTGTPFTLVRVKSLPRIRWLIRYLSLPLPYSQLSEVFGVMDEQIMSWRDIFERVANRMEPDGSLGARIKIGVTPGTKSPCLFCGRIGTAKRFDQHVWNCTGCGRLFSMRRVVVERNGRLEILNVHPDDAPEDALSGAICE